MANEKMIKDFMVRRSERFLSFSERVKYLAEMANIYKAKEVVSLLSEIQDEIKKHVVKHRSSEASSNILYSLDISDNIDEFIESITENIRTAGEILLEFELKDIKKDLIKTYIEDVIDEVEEKSQQKYLNSVKNLIQIAKLKKVNILNADVYEMEKDLRACIQYNDKIQNLKNVIMANEELSDNFVENTLKECVGV